LHFPGIHFFELPRAEAEQIHIHIVGLEITANGLGAIIFGTGIALCFVGKQSAPKSFEWNRTSENGATEMNKISGVEITPHPTATSGLPSPNIFKTSETVRVAEVTEIEDKFKIDSDLY
jgi:hypothetical protein